MLKPCAEPGCPKVVEGSRCEQHQRQQHRQDRRRRGSRQERGYDARWEKVRAMYLRAEPLCEKCKAKGKTKAADLVHHIDPLPEGDRLALENLQSLCHTCHQEEHRGR